MPLDSLDLPQNAILAKLGRVERLLVSEHQWCKGRLRDDGGRRCLVGAIEAAGAWPEMGRTVLRAAREISGKRYWRIESFNDDPRTTHADVLAVLRRARQNITAEMAHDYAPQPWHRKWVQAFRRSLPGSGCEIAVALPISRGAPPVAGRSSWPKLQLAIREDGEVA